MSLKTRMSGWKNRIAGWFIDREFFMRANGQVRFLKISAQLQRRVAGVTAFIVGAWLIVTLGMAVLVPGRLVSQWQAWRVGRSSPVATLRQAS